MKIAYLISAYKDPEHLRKLIHALENGIEESVHFFIHVDAKVDLSDFTQIANGNNVTYLAERQYVQWGGIRRYSIKRLF